MEHTSSNSFYNPKDIISKLQNITNLPAIPKVLQEISNLFSSSELSGKKVAMIIEKDPALTVKVLSVANSALYGLKRSVTSIGSAVLVLGMHEIKSIMTSLQMASTVKMNSDKYFDPDKFMNHSMSVGMLTQRMSKDLGFNFEGDGFVAGMLHDMGILVIHEFLTKEFFEIANYSAQNNIPFLEAEYKVLGLTHQEIGEFLAVKWTLPTVFSDALQFHHNPSKSKENNFLTSILHVADYAASKFEENGILWDEKYQLDESVIELLNFLSLEELDEFIEAYKSDYLEVKKSKLL